MLISVHVVGCKVFLHRVFEMGEAAFIEVTKMFGWNHEPNCDRVAPRTFHQGKKILRYLLGWRSL